MCNSESERIKRLQALAYYVFNSHDAMSRHLIIEQMPDSLGCAEFKHSEFIGHLTEAGLWWIATNGAFCGF